MVFPLFLDPVIRLQVSAWYVRGSSEMSIIAPQLGIFSTKTSSFNQSMWFVRFLTAAEGCDSAGEETSASAHLGYSYHPSSLSSPPRGISC